MKKIAQLFVISLFAGATTLGMYKLFFETAQPVTFTAQNENPFVSASYTTNTTANVKDIDFTVAAESTINAVVHVKNAMINKEQPSLWDFFYGNPTVRETPSISSGSGVIITPDGYIVSNNHVVANADQLQVTLNNNETYDATVVGTDPNTDIALLKIETKEKLPYLAFGDSDHSKVGEWVLAVGNPFNLTSTVTAGIISAKARDLGRNQSFIQTDAAVNPGNSGGALVNTNGDLIGINTAITSKTGSYVGYSFAVPSNIAKKIVEDILEYGNVQTGILGITTITNMNSPYAIEKGVKNIDGVFIESVEEDSGAYNAALEAGDIIKKIDAIEIHKFADLTGYLATKRPGNDVEVTVERDGEHITTKVTLKERQTLNLPKLGITVKNLSENDRKEYRTKKGVKIIGVPEIYRAYDLEGKILLGINDEEINTIEDAKTYFSSISRYERTSITMLNKKGERERLIFQ